MDLRDLLDDLLEITIVGSFTRIGPVVRRRLYDWTSPPPGAMAGRTVLVTGPTSGLGSAVAEELAALGARVVLVGRNSDRLEAIRRKLTEANGEDRFPAIVADMSSLASVRAAVTRVMEAEPRLDALIDNAGAIFPERTESPDGIESTLATMVVGPFALVAGLLPLLSVAGHARVIAVTSGGMYAQRLHLDDLQWRDEPFDGVRAYARAKRAQVALMREWARRVPRTAVTFNAMHPGWADTPGIAASLPGFHARLGPLLRTPTEGIDTTVWLTADPAPGATTGGLYLDRRRRPFDRVPSTRVSAADRRRLWDVVVGLAGIADPAGDPRIHLLSTPDEEGLP
jgi:NAD(P)-dependent dehydrogenase (short-subunit alcohol dehydrogenase family)